VLPLRVSPHCTKGEPALATTHRFPGAVLTERAHSVPLDHSKPDGEKITVFTRELAAPDGLDRPYLLFLPGGPGFEATRPTASPSGWQKRAIADYRVLLIDQRGTGRSTRRFQQAAQRLRAVSNRGPQAARRGFGDGPGLAEAVV
jgi:pimeloyl-ACP methyl ester carboxylesterase